MREADEVLARFARPHRRELALADVRVDLQTNCGELADLLTAYFAPWGGHGGSTRSWVVHAVQGEHGVAAERLVPVPRGRGKAPKESFREVPGGRVVLKVRTGLAFFVEPARVVVVGDVLANRGQVLNLLCSLFAQEYMDRGHVLVHASAVRSPTGRGIAFLAPSGRGKTTMALAMLERGHAFVTNDRLLLRSWSDVVDMVGVPKLPRANPGTLLRLPSLRALVAGREDLRRLDAAQLWSLEEKRDIDVRALFGASVVPRGVLHDLYVLRWSPAGQGWRMRRLDGAEAADHLWRELRDGGIFDLRSEPRLAWRQHLGAIAGQLRVFEIGGSVEVEALAEHIAAAA